MTLTPVRRSLLTSSTFVAVGTSVFSFCNPSRGDTSTICGRKEPAHEGLSVRCCRVRDKIGRKQGPTFTNRSSALVASPRVGAKLGARAGAGAAIQRGAGASAGAHPRIDRAVAIPAFRIIVAVPKGMMEDDPASVVLATRRRREGARERGSEAVGYVLQ